MYYQFLPLIQSCYLLTKFTVFRLIILNILLVLETIDYTSILFSYALHWSRSRSRSHCLIGLINIHDNGTATPHGCFSRLITLIMRQVRLIYVKLQRRRR